MIPLRQSTATQTLLIGAFVDDTDFKTLETALTIANTDIKLSKNGAAAVNKTAGGGTHIINGMYAITLDATDTNTVGKLQGSVKVAGALIVWFDCYVYEESVYDLMFPASASGDVKLQGVTHTGAVIPTVTTVSNQVTANVTAISGDTVAADNLELDYDGTGYNKTNSTIGTCAVNTDMRGTDNAALATSLATAQTDLDTITGSDGATLATTQGAITWGAQTISVTGATDSVTFSGSGSGDVFSFTRSGSGDLFDTAWIADVSAIITANTSIASILEDSNELQTDWVNGGRLDLILDARASQTTADDIQTQIGTAGAGLTDLGGMSTAMKAEVNAECDTALTDYDGPTNAEMEARTPTAAQLAYMVANAATGVPVTFTTAGGSTTVAVLALVDGASPSAVDDQYNGRLLVFTDGTLKGVVTDITDYTGGTTTATITAIPTAPTSSHNARLI